MQELDSLLLQGNISCMEVFESLKSALSSTEAASELHALEKDLQNFALDQGRKKLHRLARRLGLNC